MITRLRVKALGIVATAIAIVFVVAAPSHAQLYALKSRNGGAAGTIETIGPVGSGSNHYAICDIDADGHRAVFQLSRYSDGRTISDDVRASGNGNCVQSMYVSLTPGRTYYFRVCTADGPAPNAPFSCSGWKGFEAH